MSARSYRCTQHFGEKTTDILKQAGGSCKLESKVCIRWKNKAGDFRDTLERQLADWPLASRQPSGVRTLASPVSCAEKQS